MGIFSTRLLESVRLQVLALGQQIEALRNELREQKTGDQKAEQHAKPPTSAAVTVRFISEAGNRRSKTFNGIASYEIDERGCLILYTKNRGLIAAFAKGFWISAEYVSSSDSDAGKGNG
jgi:hypothetical protein